MAGEGFSFSFMWKEGWEPVACKGMSCCVVLACCLSLKVMARDVLRYDGGAPSS